MRARIARWLQRASPVAPPAERPAPGALKPLAKHGWVEFYDEKSTLRESFVYRRLAYDLARKSDKGGRAAIIEQFKH